MTETNLSPGSMASDLNERGGRDLLKAIDSFYLLANAGRLPVVGVVVPDEWLARYSKALGESLGDEGPSDLRYYAGIVLVPASECPGVHPQVLREAEERLHQP